MPVVMVSVALMVTANEIVSGPHPLTLSPIVVTVGAVVRGALGPSRSPVADHGEDTGVGVVGLVGLVPGGVVVSCGVVNHYLKTIFRIRFLR